MTFHLKQYSSYKSIITKLQPKCHKMSSKMTISQTPCHHLNKTYSFHNTINSKMTQKDDKPIFYGGHSRKKKKKTTPYPHDPPHIYICHYVIIIYNNSQTLHIIHFYNFLSMTKPMTSVSSV